MIPAVVGNVLGNAVMGNRCRGSMPASLSIRPCRDHPNLLRKYDRLRVRTL